MKKKIETFLRYLEAEGNIGINLTNLLAPLKFTDSNGVKIRMDSILIGNPPCFFNITSSINKGEKKIIGLEILYGNERAYIEATDIQKKIKSVIPSIPVEIKHLLDYKPILI